MEFPRPRPTREPVIRPARRGRGAGQHGSMVNRRTFLKTLFGASASYAVAGPGLLQRVLTPSDQEFLDDLAQRSFLYFWEQADPHTGLVRERVASARHESDSLRHVGS